MRRVLTMLAVAAALLWYVRSGREPERRSRAEFGQERAAYLHARPERTGRQRVAPMDRDFEVLDLEFAPASAAGAFEVSVTLPDGSPAAGARGTIFYGNPMTASIVRTDSEGRYRGNAFPEGALRLHFEYGDWTLETPELWPTNGETSIAHYTGAGAVEIRSGTTARLNVRLTEQPASFVTLRCTDAQGRSAPGMRAALEQRSVHGGCRSRSSESGREGELTLLIRDLPSGERVPVIVYDTTAWGRLARLELVTTDFDERRPVVVVVSRGVERIVDVKDPEGQIVPNARVELVPTDESGGFASALSGGSSHRVDGRGRARMFVQLGQTYRLTTTARGFQTSTVWGWVAPQTKTATTVRLQRGLLVRGRTTDEQGRPTTDGRIVIRGRAEDEHPIREGGSFTLRNLEAGHYVIQFIDGSQRLRAQMECDLSSDTDVGSMRAHPLTRMRARVVNRAGQPIAQARVRVRPGGGYATTDADGRFGVELCIFEAVWLVVHRAGFTRAWVQARALSGPIVLGQPAALEFRSGPDARGPLPVRFGPPGAPMLSATVLLPRGRIEDLPAGTMLLEGPYAGPRRIQLRAGETTEVPVGHAR